MLKAIAISTHFSRNEKIKKIASKYCLKNDKVRSTVWYFVFKFR